MKKTKLIALVCAFLSGVSGFTYGMQGEFSKKDEKDLKNGTSMKNDELNQNDKNQKSIMQIIDPNLKRYGKKRY